MMYLVLLTGLVLQAQPLQGLVPGGKLVLPDSIPECLSPTPSADIDFSPVFDNYTAGSTLTYSCRNVNWTLIGSSLIVCQNDGQWSSDEPICKYVTCGELGAIAYGGITYDNSDWPLLPGTTAVYSCQANFILQGPETRICNTNGSWTGQQEPQCISICPPLTAPHNSSVMYSPKGCRHENCTARVKCDRGFNIENNRKYSCRSDSSWVPEFDTKCTKIYCEPPGLPPEHGDVKIHSTSDKVDHYESGIMLVYTCRPGYVLQGKNIISCSVQGKWSALVPDCVKVSEPTTISSDTQSPDNATHVSTSTVASSSCGSPQPIPNGEYRIDGSTNFRVVYKCAHGYRLEGSDERICLANQSWSGHSPSCILIEHTTPRPFLWKQIFVDNKIWEGQYIYKGKLHKFKMWVTSVNIHPNGDIGARLIDDVTKFNLKGFHSTDAIVFQMSRLLAPSDRFPSLNWYVSGQLERVNYHWVYTGKIWSDTPGFTTLTMRPVHELPLAMPGHNTSPNMTALALGITIAVVSIIVAALLAAFCVKRKVGLRGGSHRTLTSFENPVYEYENSLKEPGN